MRAKRECDSARDTVAMQSMRTYRDESWQSTAGEDQKRKRNALSVQKKVFKSDKSQVEKECIAHHCYLAVAALGIDLEDVHVAQPVVVFEVIDGGHVHYFCSIATLSSEV